MDKKKIRGFFFEFKNPNRELKFNSQFKKCPVENGEKKSDNSVYYLRVTHRFLVVKTTIKNIFLEIHICWFMTFLRQRVKTRTLYSYYIGYCMLPISITKSKN